MDEAAERELIERCRQGSDAAFAELVDAHTALVFGVIWRTTADRARAEDLAQETFLKIHRGLPYFRGQARLTTWIYRIVLNVCAEARVSHETSGDRDVSLDEPRGTMAPVLRAPDRAYTDLELRDRLEKALAQLPPHVRFLVSAHYLGGQKYEELAAALDMPIGTVKTHLFRAKRRLRELLG
jgi:RNA polymerase sigma-70 factor, ECF subfamily